MKAVAFFPKDKQTRVMDEPEPQIRTGSEVKVRMLEVGMCGTDREIFAGLYGDPPAGSDHLVLGHESLGQVVEVGGEVRGLRAGDLVALLVRRPCAHEDCIACRTGRQDFCYTGDFTERGIKQASGFLAEIVVDDEHYMVAMPEELREIGVLVEPLTIAEKALEQVMQVQRRLPWGLAESGEGGETYRHKAVVLGAGPVGLLGAMALAVRGFEVYVTSREEGDTAPAHIARAIGAKYLSTTHMTMQEIGRRVGRIDLIYEATGAAQVAFDLIGQLGVNGVYVFTGVPGTRGPFKCEELRSCGTWC